MQITDSRNSKSNVDATDLFRSAVSNVFNPKTYRKSVKPKWSRFKLKFKYRDGNESVHFSYDWNPDYSTGVKKYRDDEQMGLTKLLAQIGKQQIADTYNDATIYMTLSVKKSTEVQDYDIAVGYISRENKDIKLDPRLKFTAENKVMLQLFERSNVA